MPYSQVMPRQDKFVAGNIANFVTEWEDIGASDTVLSWLHEGVHIPLQSPPPSFHLPNHKLSTPQNVFVTAEI